MESGIKTNQRNGLIDIIRIFMATLVILLHTSGNQEVLSLISGSVARLAVPFFLCISSYYFFVKDRSKEEMIRLCQKIGTIWLFWMILYLPKAIIAIRKASLRRVIFEISKALFGGSVNYGGSWYLIATIFGIFVIWNLLNNKNYRMMYSLSLVFFLIGLFSTSYGGWIHERTFLYEMNYMISPANTFIMGVPWVCLGSFLSRHFFKKKLNIKAIFIVVLLPIIEYLIICKFNLAFIAPDGRIRTDVMLSLPVSLAVLFLFFKTNTINISIGISKFFRDLSALMFFIHFGVISIIDYFVKMPSGFIMFVTVFFTTLVASIFYMFLSNIKMFSWLKLGL